MITTNKLCALLAEEGKSLTELQYENYLMDTSKFNKVIDLKKGLKKGTIIINDVDYFKKSEHWEPNDKNSHLLETTFYIYATIPKIYMCLEADLDTLTIKRSKKNTIGDYDSVLNIQINRALIPLLETEIISINKK